MFQDFLNFLNGSGGLEYAGALIAISVQLHVGVVCLKFKMESEHDPFEPSGSEYVPSVSVES